MGGELFDSSSQKRDELSETLNNFGVYFNNALNALSALANNIAQCVFRNIFKYHNSNISKTHWTFNVKYRNISITHWDSQCVFEIFMYFDMYLLNEYPISTKTRCVSQNIANAFLKYCDFQNLKNSKNPLRLSIYRNVSKNSRP